MSIKPVAKYLLGVRRLYQSEEYYNQKLTNHPQLQQDLKVSDRQTSALDSEIHPSPEDFKSNDKEVCEQIDSLFGDDD